MGGFLAASFTDLVQSIIMTVALVVVLGFGVAQAGGMEDVYKRQFTDSKPFRLLEQFALKIFV